MNCVPGLSTQFAFTPTKTTAEMKETEGEDFEYVLLCNKICGSAHFNMQMKFVVESEEDYNKWIASQKTLKNTLTLK
jgi:cytochrome c oxidase subunit 2